MRYKQTAEYAIDLLEHFFALDKEHINKAGRENIKVLVQAEIYALLAYKKKDGSLGYLTKYRGMDMESRSDISTIQFVDKN